MTEPPVADRADRLAGYLADHDEDLLALTTDLLSFDTQNPPGDTVAVVEFLRDALSDLGVDAWLVSADSATPNLIATVPGATDRCLLLNGHVDTVPYDAEEWTRDPLGEVVGDRIYGRGATDMKGAVAAMILAARAYVETGTTPPVTLRLALVSEEEVGGAAGLPSLAVDGALAADGCVIGETTCERGIHSVTVADRGSIWLTLAATGRAAHGSRPALGVNAIDRVYGAVAAIRDAIGDRPLDLDPALDGVLEESVAFYAHQLDGAAARRLFEYPSINLGTLHGGEAINSVPESATARVDIRLTASVHTPDVLAEIEALVEGLEGVSIADVSWSVGTFEAPGAPIVSAVTETAEAVTGERVYRRSATGGGDAKDLRRAGIPTVEFAVGTDTAHAADEYTTRDALRANAEVYARLPFAFADRLAGAD